jgi:hypothetical protein
MRYRVIEVSITFGLVDPRRRSVSHVPSRPAPGDLTRADYDRMSRAARRVSTARGESFIDAFKKANPEWVPDFYALG